MTRSLSGALVNKEDYDTNLQRQENTLFSQEPDFPVFQEFHYCSSLSVLIIIRIVLFGAGRDG